MEINRNVKIAAVTGGVLIGAVVIHHHMGTKAPIVLLAAAVIGTFVYSSYTFGKVAKD